MVVAAGPREPSTSQPERDAASEVCVERQPAASQPAVQLDLTSPRATLETMHRAASAGDVLGYTACLDPRVQAPMRIVLLSTARLEQRARAAVASAELVLGPDHGAAIRQLCPEPVLFSPLRLVVGQGGAIDWSRVKIELGDNVATATVAGLDKPVMLRHVGSQWRMVPPIAERLDAAAFLRTARESAEFNDALADRLDIFARQMHAGRITRDNFSGELDKAVFPTSPR